MNITVNKIAVEPFVDNSVKTEAHGTGEFKIVKIVNTKTHLVKMKVLFNSMVVAGSDVIPIESGSYIWVRADLYASTYGKEIFTSPDGDTKFILIPADRVEVFQENEKSE